MPAVSAVPRAAMTFISPLTTIGNTETPLLAQNASKRGGDGCTAAPMRVRSSAPAYGRTATRAAPYPVKTLIRATSSLSIAHGRFAHAPASSRRQRLEVSQAAPAPPTIAPTAAHPQSEIDAAMAALVPSAGPVQGVAAVERAVLRRVYGGVWALPEFASNGDRRLFHQQRHVHEFLKEVPPRALAGILGPAAIREVPASVDRRRLEAATLSLKAGPEGGNIAKGLRAWRLHLAYVQKARALQEPPHDLGLPCSRAGVAAVVAAEARRARTTGGTVREGFIFLADVVGMPFDVSHLLVEAAAIHPGSDPEVARPVKHAASLPLGIQCQLEVVAADPSPSPRRLVARALLVSAFLHHIRLNDALNARLWVGDGGIIEGLTTVRSKHGVPLGLFAAAEGWLGPLRWWPEHAADMASRKHAIPDFAGSSLLRAAAVKGGVITRAKVLPALQELCSLPPLSMSATQFDALGLTMHSPHGTGSDMVRFVQAELPFTVLDARAIGHWLRDKKAPQEAVQADGHFTQGAANAREGMSFRYSQGAGRRGERQEQLSVRARLLAAVRAGLDRAGCPWHALPRSLESWDCLLPSFCAQ